MQIVQILNQTLKLNLVFIPVPLEIAVGEADQDSFDAKQNDYISIGENYFENEVPIESKYIQNLKLEGLFLGSSKLCTSDAIHMSMEFSYILTFITICVLI